MFASESFILNAKRLEVKRVLNLIPCGGSLVYFKDIWRRPIGKFLFTSVVIHSLVVCVIVLLQRGVIVFLRLLGFCQLLASPEVDMGAANPLHHRLHKLLAEVEQQVTVLRSKFDNMLLSCCQPEASYRVCNNFP